MYSLWSIVFSHERYIALNERYSVTYVLRLHRHNYSKYRQVILDSQTFARERNQINLKLFYCSNNKYKPTDFYAKMQNNESNKGTRPSELIRL